MGLCLCTGLTRSFPQNPRALIQSVYRDVGAYSRNFSSTLSFQTNAASLGYTVKPALALLTEQKFLLKELKIVTAAAQVASFAGGLGLQLQYAGGGGYAETKGSVAYGRSLGQVSLGSQISFSSIKTANGGRDATVHADVASLWQLSEKLVAGISLSNVLGGKFWKNREERVPIIYRLGLGYELSNAVCAALEIEKEQGAPVDWRLAVCYRLENKFQFRAGLSTGTDAPWLASAFRWKNIKVELFTSYHSQLGISPALALFIILNTAL